VEEKEKEMAKERVARGIEWWDTDIHTCNVNYKERSVPSVLFCVISYSRERN
jgi:hypothetical protein